MKTKIFTTLLLATILTPAFIATPVMAKKRPALTEETSNNLSYPVIAVDGFSITPKTEFITVPYIGDYSGLTDEEIDELEASGPWYPQKTDGNIWQAGYLLGNQVREGVTYIDWGDNIESINPKVRRPFRLEVTLYQELATPLVGYTMAVLENPSSSSEVQGTNKTQYGSSYATIVSESPKMRIQYFGAAIPELSWNESDCLWENSNADSTVIPISFGPELNVAGKYIFGSKEGGWKPQKVGWYRLTFYLSKDTNGTPSVLDLTTASIANYSAEFYGESEGTAAVPVVDTANNLSYVDVKVVSGGGKKGGKKGVKGRK